MKVLIGVFLLCLLAASANCQETAFPQQFTGSWATDFGTLYLCTLENKVYGGFETGFSEGVLQPDRRTLGGTFFFAGNTPDSTPRGFRLSLDLNATNLYGFVQSGTSSDSVVYERLSWESPTDSQCRIPSFNKLASIGGHWKAILDDSSEIEIDICLSDDGFFFEATSTDGFYYRGPVLSGGVSGAGTLFSSIAPPAPYAYGGALFRVIDAPIQVPPPPSPVFQLVLTKFSTDLGLVMSNGCNSEDLLACSETVFTYVEPASPGTCNSQSSLAVWSGYWTFHATNSQLVTRVIGNKVFGNYLFGVFEGTIDDKDPLLVTGIYFSATWTSNAFFDGQNSVNYYGTFRIQMSPDGQSFSGTIWANNGQSGGCVSGGCERDWEESRLPGYLTDPSAREVNGIDPTLSEGMTTLGRYEYNGHFLDGVNKAYYYRCLFANHQKPAGQPLPNLQFNDNRTRSYGTYTEWGCGRSFGIQRSETEFGNESIEPEGTSASEQWIDETGQGTQLLRRVSDDTLRVNWFFQNSNEVFPDLSFCPENGFDSCAGVISYIFDDATARVQDCAYCFASSTQSPASLLSVSFALLSFLMFFFFN